ncbi:MAG: hypothetical protein ACREE7_19775, partial [Dongiaceae bacterium]
MGSGFDIILLALFAVFLVVRLYKVLGRRTGHEQPRDPFAGVSSEETRRDKVIALPNRRTPGADESGRETAPAGISPVEG